MTSRRVSVVRHLLVGAASHDAITNIALDATASGHYSESSEIYSWFEPDVSVASLVRPVRELPRGCDEDVLVYHLSYGIPDLTALLLSRTERLVVWYHNVTPAEFFQSIDSEFAEGLAHGRREIEILRSRCIFAIADSTFNSNELGAAGYGDVVVARPSQTATRLSGVGADATLLERVWGRFPGGFILCVSQVLPHKRVDQAVEVLHLLREYQRLDIGLVWAGPARQPRYMEAITALQRRLNQPNVEFVDIVSDGGLAALYRACVCFVSFSDHEGLSLPPLEAMANRAPVIVKAAGAVPETVGSGALVLPRDIGVMELSEVIGEVCRNGGMRSQMRINGDGHLKLHRDSGAFRDAVDRIHQLAS
mgnify:FL=1